jgi:hypothetical protein
MKSSRDSLLDRRGPFTTALVQVFRATKAGALYAIIVFLIGFILGTIRVVLLAPRLGQTGNTDDSRGELVRRPLVRGSARCRGDSSGWITDGLGSRPDADCRQSSD